ETPSRAAAPRAARAVRIFMCLFEKGALSSVIRTKCLRVKQKGGNVAPSWWPSSACRTPIAAGRLRPIGGGMRPLGSASASLHPRRSDFTEASQPDRLWRLFYCSSRAVFECSILVLVSDSCERRTLALCDGSGSHHGRDARRT